MSVPLHDDSQIPDNARTASERLSHLLVLGARDHAIFMMDPHGILLTHNPGVERVLGYREEEWVGQHAGIIFTPEDRASGEDRRELSNAAENGKAEDIRWHVRRDGSRIWADGVVTPLYDDTGTLIGFGKVMRDATDRKRAQTTLRDAEERLRLAAEATGVGTFDFAPMTGELRWDERCKALFGLPPDAPVDYDVFLAFTHPEDRERVHEVVAQALAPHSGADGVYAVEFRTASLADDGGERWVLARGRAFFDPERTQAERLVGTVLDVTERRRYEDELRFSEERLRDVQMQMESALLAGDIGTWNWDMAQEGVRGDAMTARLFSLDADDLAAGRVPVERFFDAIHEEDRPRAQRSVAEAMAGKEEYGVEYRVLLPDGSWRWVAARGRVLLDSAGIPSFMSGAVVDITERVGRERREKFLADLAERARALTNPEAVIVDAVRSVGEFLHLSRCTFADIDAEADVCTIHLDYCADGVPSIAGVLPWSSFGPIVSRELEAGRAVVVDDVHAAHERVPPEFAAAYDGIGVRSHVTVPAFHSERLVSVISAQSATPRRWAPEEVALVLAVAERTSLTVEIARQERALLERERNIAEQLQAALQPPPPPKLPGLALEGFYRPALAEAVVGGDFYDVFSVEKGCTALVVGDLSGKGLAAASEVATVRNMVRYAVYSGRTLAEAVQSLHNILVEHGLLTGFATLFVGVYDHTQHTLTYVNCGQEPGLIWRAATDAVEHLPPTGTVLGGFNGSFTQAVISLGIGDVLAAFTDGLTDAGPNRTSLLGVEGVADLMRSCCAAYAAAQASDPRAVVDCLIAGVDAFGQGGTGDDIALLVGVVGGSSSDADEGREPR